MSARPVGPDDLPLEEQRSAEEAALAVELSPRGYLSRPIEPEVHPYQTAGLHPEPHLRPRPLLLRALPALHLRPKGE